MFNLDSPKVKSLLPTFEKVIKYSFRSYTKSNISEGDIIYNDITRVFNFDISLRLTAVGLTLYSGRDAVVANIEGYLSSSPQEAKFSGNAHRRAEAALDLFDSEHPVGQPRDLIFGANELEIREAVEHAAEDELVGQHRRHLGEYAERTARHVDAILAMQGEQVDLATGDSVQRDRLIQLLRAGPEEIVDLVMIGRPFAPRVAIR